MVSFIRVFNEFSRGQGGVTQVSVQQLYPEFNFPTIPGSITDILTLLTLLRVCFMVGSRLL